MKSGRRCVYRSTICSLLHSAVEPLAEFLLSDVGFALSDWSCAAKGKGGSQAFGVAALVAPVAVKKRADDGNRQVISTTVRALRESVKGWILGDSTATRSRAWRGSQGDDRSGL
jgi:hypothetical protein